MKKLLSIILSLLMVLSVVPAFAISASAEYADDTVAIIGDAEYTSLFGEDGALAAATADDTVVVVKDVKESGAVTLDNEVTLDLAGHTVINYGTAKIITTSAPITIKSTVDGLGETNTEAKASFKHSGVLLTTSSDINVENVNFKEANTFPEYEEESIFDPESATWEHKRYRYQNNYWGLGTYDNYTRTANSTLIPVEPSTQYYFKCIENLADTFSIEVFSYKIKADGDAHPDTGVKVPGGELVSVTGSLGATSGGVITTGASTAYIGINVYCSNNEWSYNNAKDKIMPKLKDGTITPFISKVTALCSRDTSVKNNIFNITADGTTFKATNSIFDKSSCDANSSDLFSFAKATTFDVDGCTFKAYNLNGKDLVTFNNSAIKGVFKNTNIGANNGNGVRIKSVDTTEGLTLEKCTITGGGDGRTAFIVDGGYVRLIGGTFGNNGASNNTYFNAGKGYISGTKFNGAKANCALSISASANVTIESASFVKSSKTINDQTIFLNSLMEGRAVYSSATPSAETILSRTASYNSLDVFYVLPCEHYCVGSQAGSLNCGYCLSENVEIVHDYSTIKYNETHHWGVCVRCDDVQEEIEHEVGENGKAATCTEAAICGTCAQSFGEELGHSFTDYQPVSTDIAGCEHNPVTKAICDNGCGEEEYDYSALVNLKVTQEAVEPTCTEEGSTEEQSCTECDKVIAAVEVVDALGHEFGEVVVEKDSNYAYTGTGIQTCLRDGCGFEEEVVVPVKEFLGSTLAITGDYDNPVQHKTIQDAVNDADEGDTIILVKDGIIEGKVTLDKEIILDLAGYTLTASTDSASFVTSKNLELRSTVLGLGEKYSGLVEVAPSTDEDTYGTIADVANGDLYVMGHYNSGNGKLENYENRIANKKLIAVDPTRSYIFKTGCNIQYVIREFNKKGRFAKSVGAVADGATYTPSSADVAYIGVAFWISGDSKTDILSMIQNDEFNPTIEFAPLRGAVNFSKPFVQTSAQFKMSNIKAVSSANTTFVSSTATDVAAPAKFVAKDCQFTTSGSSRPLYFTSNAIELDISDSSIYTEIANINGFEIASTGVFGKLTKVKISKNGNNALYVSKTAEAGITFDGCTISTGNYDITTATIAGGNVTFTGGSKVTGSGNANNPLSVSGGKVIFDGATVTGNKGANTSSCVLRLSGSPTLIIKNASFLKDKTHGTGGMITNNLAKFRASLAEGSAFFTSTTMNANTVTDGSNIVATDMAVYVGECGHWEKSVSKAETCTVAHTCNFCAMSFDPLGHEYSAYDNDETTHWRICVRCKEVDPVDNEPEAHFGGEATCDEPAECEKCEEFHGEALGHDFPKAGADGKYSPEDYAFDENTHWICCTREGCDEAKEGTTEEHNGGTAKCEEKAVCADCAQEYGMELGHSYIRYVSDNNASCNIDGTETALCENGCGTSVSRPDEGSKLGHNWVADYGYAPTCEKTGLTNGSHCDFCGIIREEQEVIPVAANGHRWNDGVIKQEGTCSTDLIFIYTCLDCKTQQEYNLGKIVDKHDFETTYTVDKAATFQDEGSKSMHCKNCDEATGTVVIPKMAFSAAKVGNGIEVKWDAFAGTGAHYELERKVNDGEFVLIQNYLTTPYCLDTTAVVDATYVYRVTVVCGDVKSTSGDMTVVVGATVKPDEPSKPGVCVHTTTIKNAKAATYFEAGYTGDTVCIKCGVTTAKGVVKAQLKLAKPKFTTKLVGKKIKVGYKKVAGANKIQIRYRVKGKWTIKTYKATKNVTKTLKKLTKGTYKVQVRALVVSGGKTAYSGWAKKRVNVK